MDYQKFRLNWETSLKSSLVLGGVCGVLGLAVVLLAGDLVTARQRVIIIPPNITTQAFVGETDASENYYKAWGLYVASMIGNITPDNSEFTADALGQIISSNIFASARMQMIDFAHTEQIQGVTSYYHPESIVWQPSTQTCFVTGKMTTTTNDLMKTNNNILTFQMNIKIVSGMPQITSLTSYEDYPHTLVWLEQHPQPKKSNTTNSGASQ